MSYLNNFADTTVVQSIRDGDLRYIESDIFRFEVPPSVVINRTIGENYIGLDLNREYFELHLYNRDTDQLVASVAVPFSEGYLYIREGATENNIRLGLTFWQGDTEAAELTNEERAETFLEKYLSDIPAGEYDCIINFFADELGTYNEDQWQIKAISPSRREVILERNPDNDQIFDYVEYQQFSYRSIFSEDFVALTDNLYQSGENNQYRRLINNFIARLDSSLRQTELFNNFDGEDRQRINAAFNVIYRELLQETIAYVENEVDNRRYRVVKETFEYWLKNTVWTIVGRHINMFPEGGTLFVVDDSDFTPEEPPEPTDPPPPITPPVSDQDDTTIPIDPRITDVVPEIAEEEEIVPPVSDTRPTTRRINTSTR